MAIRTSTAPRANILRNGAILLGKHVACDGFDWNRPVGAITHIHQDHTRMFETSMGFCDPLLMSAATKDLLIALKGDYLLLRRNLLGMSYGTPLTYSDEVITLYPTQHILGASQILVQDAEGTRIVYTGDFNFPTKVIPANILVVDATYGDPTRIRTYNANVPVSRLLSLVRKEVMRGKPVHIFSYHGKIQQIMHHFACVDINVPFLVTLQDFKMAQIYKKYGFKIGDCIRFDDPEASDIIERCNSCVAFHTVGSNVPEAKGFLSIRVSAYEGIEPIFRAGANRYVVAISDHADFNGILEYVKESQPKLVITDASRGGSAFELAEEIRRRLNIESKALPT